MIKRSMNLDFMEELIANLICSIGIGVSLILTISFFSKRKLHLSFLGLLFLSFFLQLSEEWLWINDLIRNCLPLLELSEFAIFVPAPALYLYAKYQIKDSFQLKDLLHFLPVLLVLVNFAPLIFADEALKSCYVDNKLNLSTSFFCETIAVSNNLILAKERYWDLLNIAQLIIYIILTIPILKEIPQNKAKKLEHDYINWTKLLALLVIMAILLIIIDVLWIDTKFDTFSVLYLTAISSVLCVYLIRRSMFMDINQRANNYIKLSDQEIEVVYDAVKQHLLTEQAYLKKNISLSTVAQSIGIPRNKIKYALETMNQEFKHLLNELRIKKAKELLSTSSQLTIEAIGNEVGYSSKATFYKYFKMYEGETPNEFLSKL